MIAKNCTCSEGRIGEPDRDCPRDRAVFIRSLPPHKNGGYLAPQVHDCGYVRRREKCVPHADRSARNYMIEKFGIGWDSPGKDAQGRDNYSARLREHGAFFAAEMQRFFRMREVE